MSGARRETFAALRSCASRVSGRAGSDISECTRFDELGMTLLQTSQLVACLEDRFGIEIPYMKFRRKQTIADAVDYVMELMEE